PVTGVFKLLLGQDVDFVSFRAEFHQSASYTKDVPLSQYGGVTAATRFSGSINADFYFRMAYDTYGVREFLGQLIQGNFTPGLLADGLYFDSTANKPLAQISGKLGAGGDVIIPTPVVIGLVPIFIFIGGTANIGTPDDDPFVVRFRDPDQSSSSEGKTRI